jgi:hypothetical protein
VTDEPKKRGRGRPRIEDTENDSGVWAEDFRKAGGPDLDNPGTDLDWTRKLQLICLHQMATTPFPTTRQQDCWQRIRAMSAVVGMTSNRAQLESKTKKLEKMLTEKSQGGGVRFEDGAKVAKSPNARGKQMTPRIVQDDGPSQDDL